MNDSSHTSGVTSVDDALTLLAAEQYVADRSLATAVFLSLRLGRPLFLEGEAGVGKTEVAKVLANGLGRDLIRLQCYEGLDVSSAVYEWNYARQMIESAPGRSRRRSIARGTRPRHFLGAVPGGAATSVGLAAAPGRRPGVAHRRAGSNGRAFRSLPAGAAVRVPDHDPRARSDQGGAAARRGHHIEPHSRDSRCAEAALLLLLGGLSQTPSASFRS